MFYRQRGFKNRNATGIEGERIAVRHLEKNQYRIVVTNYRCKIGEIDIIAAKDEFLVFVEVKTRNESAEEIDQFISINKSKQAKLRQLGTFYIRESNVYDRQPRFDVIGITIRDAEHFTLEHIENAF
jgi:putative endonuclease